MIPLPTIEECREFMDAINRGRVACGLEPIERLEFDACAPGDPQNCLSAHHLIASLGGSVMPHEIVLTTLQSGMAERLVKALETDVAYTLATEIAISIPATISSVTDPFDQRVNGLRERLVEAGLVE